MKYSHLFESRLKYKPIIPDVIKKIEGSKTQEAEDKEQVRKLFESIYYVPLSNIGSWKSADIHKHLKVGIILNGRKAAGNVILGLFDVLK